MKSNRLIRLVGSNFYYSESDCLASMFQNFAIEYGMPIIDMHRAFNSATNIYYAVNQKTKEIKLVKDEGGNETVIQKWEDAELFDTFMAYNQLYYHLYREAKENQPTQ